MNDNIHTIQSDALSVSVSERGAELTSIFSKKTNTEYLWQRDPAIWDKQAPVLFPIVGRLVNGKYVFDEKEYEMGIHGFAAATKFDVEYADNMSASSLLFTCSDTKETREIYPFAFNFRVFYYLKWNVLETIYLVENKTNGPMYFSFGSHEGFCCPRHEGEEFSDYYLEFDHDNDYHALALSPNKLLTESAYTVLENDKRLQLDYKLFENDAIVMADCPSGKVILGSKKSKAKIEMDYTDAPNLGIWTKIGAPYVCIEPWYGLPDFEGTDGDITKKPGIIRLEKDGVFSWKHSITIYE